MNKGFIALTLVITITSLLLAFSYTRSIETALFFDQVRLKEYRLISYYNAGSCIDQAVLNLAHDYFYTVTDPVLLSDFGCTIDSLQDKDGIRVVEVYGNYKNIKVKRRATVKIYDNKLEISSIE